MRIAIIGAGSIGLLFSSYINSDFDVTLYTRTKEQAEEINHFGLTLKKGVQITKIAACAVPFTEWDGTEDLSIITVKQYQLDSIISKLNDLPVTTNNLLFLQNGMGHLKLLNTLKANNIFVGSVEHGAYRENPYTVSHNGDGVTNVSVVRGDSAELIQFASSAPSNFPIVIKEDYYRMLTSKLIVNAVINPLTALLHVKNGDLIRNPFYLQTVEKLFAEICQILNLENREENLKKIKNICDLTADNRSSMLKDLEAGRSTEVDAILGFLLEEAIRKDMEAPIVASLSCLIKGKEYARGDYL